MVGLLSALTDLVLPPRCGGCGTAGDWLCAACRARVRRPEEPLCRRCGTELESAGQRCSCRHRLRSLRSIRSAAAYEGPVERAIHSLKYEGRTALAGPLAGLIADHLAADPVGCSTLIAVPLHPARQRRRGYNQSELLARELRARFGLPTPPPGLVRTRDTPPQVGLDRASRAANVSEAFRWTGPGLGGVPLVLVDDVTTTGATLEACARSLRAAGAGPVIGVTVAHVRI